MRIQKKLISLIAEPFGAVSKFLVNISAAGIRCNINNYE